MSDKQTKALVVELPTQLLRNAKADAARRGVSIRQWWTEAGEARVPPEYQRGIEPAE